LRGPWWQDTGHSQMRGPFPIPFPLGTFPGQTPQEGAGRLINCCSEPLGHGGPAPATYKRQPGLTQFAVTAMSGYRGGLIVQGLSYEAWSGQAATVDSVGAVSVIGSFPGTKHISIARNQNNPPDVVAVDPDQGAFILATGPLLSATATATVAGTVFVPGDQVSLTIDNTTLAGLPVTVTYKLGSGETPTTIATGLTALINANTTLQGIHLSATSAGAVITISQQGSDGNQTTLTALTTPVGSNAGLVGTVGGPGGVGHGNQTVTIAPGSGSATATIGGTTFPVNDTVTLTFTNPSAPSFPVAITYTFLAGATAIIIATGLVSQINANATLTAAGISATNVGGTSAVITILQPIGDTAITFSSDTLSGGSGTPGIVGPFPAFYTGQGRMGQANSVAFQDGYLFFTMADGRVFATTINGLGMNGLTFITIQSRSDVTLLRGVAFSGNMFFFTTGHCEVWSDAGNPPPAFPYSRQVVLPYGLLQTNAIAGFETGFDDLSWVAQDFGVWELAYGQLNPTKISPPDLDRLIETEHRANNLLEASVYMIGGKKFWVLSSPNWTWEFNLSTQQWNERWSLTMFGTQGRWRGTGGHPAFGKWLLGDTQSGTLCFVDDRARTELGAPMLQRLESGPVANFPNRIRVARADFNFSVGQGEAVRALVMTVQGTLAGPVGGIHLLVDRTQEVNEGDTVIVAGVTGTVEANGTWPVHVVSATELQLGGSHFVNAYTGGGTVTDVTSPTTAIDPQVAISWSDDGGLTWGNPLLRSLGQQGMGKTVVDLIRCGVSSRYGRRWRIDFTDAVNAPFMSATQSDELRKY
jgi:hypothetical protein